MKILLIVIGVIVLLVFCGWAVMKSHDAEVEYQGIIVARQQLRERYRECKGCPYLNMISLEHQNCEVEARLCPRAKWQEKDGNYDYQKPDLKEV